MDGNKRLARGYGGNTEDQIGKRVCVYRITYLWALFDVAIRKISSQCAGAWRVIAWAVLNLGHNYSDLLSGS